jgi:hypothetical protein
MRWHCLQFYLGESGINNLPVQSESVGSNELKDEYSEEDIKKYISVKLKFEFNARFSLCSTGVPR